MFEFLGIDYFLGLVPTWVPWVIVVMSIILFILIQFFQVFIPQVYRVLTVIVVEILSLVLFGFGFYIDGRQDVIVNAKQEIEKTVTEQNNITEEVRNKLLDNIKNQKEKHETIIKLVPQYITKEDDFKCVIPQSFIKLHNYAAKDSVPESTTRANGIATGIELITGK
jgi:energy-coupling factor transporter transmembrane protein EcfT